MGMVGRRYRRRRAGILIGMLFVIAPSCSRSRAPGADRIDSLVASTDSIAIYNAGVDAFRAKDYAVARVLWRRAADLGVAHTRSNLGYLLYYGLGGWADSTTAARLWQEAIAEGDAEAHRHVAQAILDGNRELGTLVDAYAHTVASRLLAKDPQEYAGDQIERDADRLSVKIAAGLTPPERARAEELGRRWAREAPNR